MIKKKIILMALLAMLCISAVFASDFQIGAAMTPGFTAIDILSAARGEAPFGMGKIKFAPYMKGDLWCFSADTAMFMYNGEGDKFDMDLRVGGGINLKIVNGPRLYAGSSFTVNNLISANELNNQGVKARIASAPVTYHVAMGIPIKSVEFIMRMNVPSSGTVYSMLKDLRGFNPDLKHSTFELGTVYTF